MTAEPRWLVSLAESDRKTVEAWAARCERLGAAASVAGALRKAVELAESLTDDDVKRGYA
jgi:hypothetical protein